MTPLPKVDLYTLTRCSYCKMLTGATADRCGWCNKPLTNKTIRRCNYLEKSDGSNYSETPNSSSSPFVQLAVKITVSKIVTACAKSLIGSGELDTKIGFYKECRKSGIYINKRYGDFT